MSSLWVVAKGVGMALDSRLKDINDIPYTIAFVIRKRMQIDNLNELEKEKRPTDRIIWEGSPEEMDDWLDRVLKRKEQQNLNVYISDDEIG